MVVGVLLTVMACVYHVSLPLCYRIGLEGRVIYDFDWFVLDLQMLIMPNRKLCVLIIYIVLGPQASWAPGGRTACPSLRAGPACMYACYTSCDWYSLLPASIQRRVHFYLRLNKIF
jgi:hypothetical protein